MVQQNFSPGPAAERKQLLVLAGGLALVSGAFWWFGPGLRLAWVPGSLALLALAGGAAYSGFGRNVYLVFAVGAFLIGACVSWLALGAIYVLAIAGCGSLLKAFGMDMLRKRFDECKSRPSMFENTPVTDQDSFRRQS